MSIEIIAAITAAHRTRKHFMDLRKIVDQKLGALLRLQFGWRKSLPEAERKAIAKYVADLIDGDPKEWGEWAETIAASHEIRDPLEKIERGRIREMERLAKQLPVWKEFGEGIRGFGAASLAVIVAEAGDLSDYATEAKLWKRMGVAVLDGVRQGGLSKSASAEAWIEHGYNRQRRSRMWNIGDALIKGNRGGKYRTCYLARKEYELAREPDMAPIKAHRRAQRYMEKRLLRDLWRAWRRTGLKVAERPSTILSAAQSIAAE